MIYGVIGDLGGGKSYYTVRLMAHHIKAGGAVATNIELQHDNLARYTNKPVPVLEKLVRKIDPDVDGDPWQWPVGDPRGTPGGRRVMIVIDEVGEWFSSFEKRENLQNFFSWLRQSDKRGQDVYLIVQYASLLAKGGREVCHHWLAVRNMSKAKIPGIGWKLPPPVCFEFHARLFDRTGKIHLKTYKHIRETAIFKLYQTSAMFGVSALQSSGDNPYNSLQEGDLELTLNEPLKEISIKLAFLSPVVTFLSAWYFL